MLVCSDCDAVHDVDLAPDEGACVVCGGALIEDASERGEVGPGAFRAGLKEVAQFTNERLVAANVREHVALAPLNKRGAN